MRNHFNSAHRWDYIIISVTGSGHKHYLVSDVVDSNSLYPIKNNYDFRYDNYRVADSDSGDYYSIYALANPVDKSGYYLVKNTVNSCCLFVIYNEVDYNK